MSDVPLKHCPTCPEGQQWHPATEEFFYRDRLIKDGWRGRCKECRKLHRLSRQRLDTTNVPAGYKRCTACGGDFPATEAFFHRDKSHKDGLGSRCKECLSKRDKNRYPNLIRHTVKKLEDAPSGQKRCSVCELPFLATTENFYRKKAAKDGLSSWCKPCRKQWECDHMKQPDTRMRKADYYKEWASTHRELIHLYQRNYYVNAENHEKNIARSRTHSMNRKIRKKAIQGTHTPEQIEELLKRQKYRCYYAACGFSKFKRIKEHGQWKYLYHIEHTYPISRVVGTDIPANDISYIVLSCDQCNMKKHNKFPWEFPEGGRLL